MLLLVSSACAGDGLTLARDGSTGYVICLAHDAIPAERTAAEQLQKYLGETTGAAFEVVDEREAEASKGRIYVGAGDKAKALLPDEDWAGLRQDGIVIKTVGKDLVLAGGRPRGTLYAVFQFLEDYAGCRWWTPKEKTIPRVDELKVPDLSVRYVPTFSYREHFTIAARYNPEFATILRENGRHEQQTDDWGGHHDILGFVHTFSQLLPPARYFKEHPEWYTDGANGWLPSTKKSALPEAEHTQLCLSNPEVLKELTKNALQWIKENPNAGYISISQNDYTAFCRCPNCRAIAEREGSQSGVILQFVNAVAAEIGKQYPGFLVETLAYTYSEKPPRFVRPAKNVVIRLALATADYGHPMDSAWNTESRDKLLAWSAIAPRLFIWSYNTNFRNTLFPHPNWNSLAVDLRFYAAHHVEGMFAQGDCYNDNVGDFIQLRAWLMGKLLWNPDLDQEVLITEFLNGYYGAAGPFLGRYLRLINESFLAQNRGLNTNNPDLSFLTLEVANQTKDLFRQAREAVAGDPELLTRVRREELSSIIARISRDNALRAEAEKAGAAYPTKEQVAQECEDFVREAKEFGVARWSEHKTFETGLADMLKTSSPEVVELPAFAKHVDRRDVIDFLPSMVALAADGNIAKTEDDELAKGGHAVSLTGSSDSWVLQAHLGPYLDAPNEMWHLYIVTRVSGGEPNNLPGYALEGGVFDDSDMKSESRFSIAYNRFAQSHYQVLDLGSHRLTSGMLVWFAPQCRAPVDKILIERVLLIRESVAARLDKPR